MKEIINVYKQNRVTLENYLISTLRNKKLQHFDKASIHECFQSLPSAVVIYKVSSDYTQSTPFYYRKRTDASSLGINRDFMFNKIQLDEERTYISQAYISSHTGESSITVVRELEGEFLVIDFSLLKLLEELRFIENNRLFNHASKTVYGVIGASLIFFSLFLTGFALYTFAISLNASNPFDLNTTFRSIIALTLGLAIFDLSTTIMKQEVFYKSYVVEQAEENNLLIRFLSSIIIALSIESLMVVFKIALSDYKEMHNAIYLIGGVSSMIIALGIFSYLSKKNPN